MFGLYAGHGGGPAIAAFSRAHGLNVSTWAAALVLMALCEVAGRTLILGARAVTTRNDRGGRPGALPVISTPLPRR